VDGHGSLRGQPVRRGEEQRRLSSWQHGEPLLLRREEEPELARRGPQLALREQVGLMAERDERSVRERAVEQVRRRQQRCGDGHEHGERDPGEQPLPERSHTGAALGSTAR
jgi:hypothetical protein